MLFTRTKSTVESRLRDKSSAFFTCLDLASPLFALDGVYPVTFEFVEGSGSIGGIPVLEDANFPHPYGGLYWPGRRHVRIVTYRGRYRYEVVVHECLHAVLDQVDVRWHHTAFQRKVLGWYPEEYAKQLEARWSGTVGLSIRNVLHLPVLVTREALVEGEMGISRAVADLVLST